jgi:putative transposase-like DNA-binding protein
LSASASAFWLVVPADGREPVRRSGCTVEFSWARPEEGAVGGPCDVAPEPRRWTMRPRARDPGRKEMPQAVAVEDLAVRGLARTRLAKAVHDAGWSAFLLMLEYKARRYGREFRRIGRFEPTSQVCSACGVKDGPKPLHVRAWQCRECGAWLDRDVNAAVNVARAAGLAVSACGAQVRPGVIPAQRGEAGTLRGAA